MQTTLLQLCLCVIMFIGGAIMRKYIIQFLIVIENFSLFISGILAIIFYNCFNLNFYKNFYQKAPPLRAFIFSSLYTKKCSDLPHFSSYFFRSTHFPLVKSTIHFVAFPSFSEVTYCFFSLRLKRTIASFPSGSFCGASAK